MVLPPHVRARASYGPEVHAQAADLTCGRHVPVARAAVLPGQLGGVDGVRRVDGRGPRQGRRADRGQRVRPAGSGTCCVYAPWRCSRTRPRPAPTGGLRYVHLTCTAYLTLMHTGDRSDEAIDADGVLPGYAGILARDGYHDYALYLTDAAARLVLPRTCSATSRACIDAGPDTEQGPPRQPACG